MEKHVKKVELQGYLLDGLTALDNAMTAAGFQFSNFQVCGAYDIVKRAATVKKITVEELHTAFIHLQDCRAAFAYMKAEAAEAAEALERATAVMIAGYAEDLTRAAADIVRANGFRLPNDIVTPFLPIFRAVENGSYEAPRATFQASADYAAAMDVYKEAADMLKRKQEETERKERERQEAEARRAALLERLEARGGNGFQVNAAAVLNTFHVSESEDMAIIDKQLDDAPLFSGIYPRMIYRKRAPIMYELTNGAEVLEAAAVEYSDYMTRFHRELDNAVNEFYYSMTYTDYVTFAEFWQNAEAMRRGVIENRVSAEDMAKYGIRSPKFSKYLVKTFGERSSIVKLFNDRPTAAEVEKEASRVIEDKKVIVSNLAANVMKMTAGNDFSSCQDYTYEDECDLDYLHKLPSSVHDELMAIAYVVDESEDYESPHMLARVLIAPLVYHGQLCFIGHNMYHGGGDNGDILKASLKNLYGERFLMANDMYNTSNMTEYRHKYDYDMIVHFEYNNDCYLCEGSGSVDVEIRWHDYQFSTECPECAGSGNNGNSYGGYPYIDNRSFIQYSCNEKIVKADEKTIVYILTAETEADNGETATA